MIKKPQFSIRPKNPVAGGILELIYKIDIPSPSSEINIGWEPQRGVTTLALKHAVFDPTAQGYSIVVDVPLEARSARVKDIPAMAEPYSFEIDHYPVSRSETILHRFLWPFLEKAR